MRAGIGRRWIDTLKHLAARLPRRSQQWLKRHWFAWKIRINRFTSDEAEYGLLDTFLRPGDWALDIGANVGYYAARMSQLVGLNGRVIAFEPTRESFELLVANSQLFAFANTTLMNVAVSDKAGTVRMAIPTGEGGTNWYEAHITDSEEGDPALAISIDSLGLTDRVALVKIDTEGHELAVLHGMRRLIVRDHPVLIVEANSADVATLLEQLGYSVEQGDNPTNYLCRFQIEASEDVVKIVEGSG